MLRYILPVTGVLLCAGCSTNGTLPPVASLQNQIENLEQTLRLSKQSDVEHFAACMAPLSTKFKSGLLALTDKLHPHPMGPLLAAQLGALDESMLTDETENLRDYLNALANKLVHDIRTDSQDSAIKDTFDKTQQATSPTKEDIEAVAKRSEVYLKAYFTKGLGQLGRLLPLNDLEKAILQVAIDDVVKHKPDDPTAAKVIDELAPLLQKMVSKNVDTSPGFISRDGTTYNFPGATGACTQTNINHSQIEADVIRIILEALRDSYAPLPVLANSTAATIDGTDILVFGLDHSAPTTVNWHINHKDVGNALQFTLTADQFQAIEAKARSVESAAAGVIGKAIRGGSWGSLNNEAVARSLETAAGVLARHSAERAEWCVHAQRSKAVVTQP